MRVVGRQMGLGLSFLSLLRPRLFFILELLDFPNVPQVKEVPVVVKRHFSVAHRQGESTEAVLGSLSLSPKCVVEVEPEGKTIQVDVVGAQQVVLEQRLHNIGAVLVGRSARHHHGQGQRLQLLAIGLLVNLLLEGVDLGFLLRL